jgi:predicted lipoprotein with Yx(FWY)xxD motif
MIRVGRRFSATAALAVLVAGAVLETGGAALGPTVKTAKNSELGSILVGATGRTVYHYTDDRGTSVDCKGTCLQTWPPVLIARSARPVAGPGVTASKLGTITRPDGTVQVTYNGYPLYRFSGDTKAGQANGQGLEKSWYAVAPSGAVVRTTVAASAANGTGGSTSAGASSSGGTTTTGAGGGYGDY